MDPMPTNSSQRREPEPARRVRTVRRGTFLAGVSAFALAVGSALLADDQAPAPKPSPTPRPPAAQAKRPVAAAKPAVPEQNPEPALRFDDFDLERYHKPVPQPADDEVE